MVRFATSAAHRSLFRRLEELRFTRLHRRPVNLDIVDFAEVIEGAEANVTRSERFVFTPHDRPRHVVEIDFDRAAGELPFEPHFVPGILPPDDAGADLFADGKAGR